MEQITFSTDLESNIRLMQAIFQGDNTFVTRRAAGHKGLCCAVFFFDGMVNNIAINQSVIRPIVCADCAEATADELARTILQINDSRVETDTDKLFAAFLYGDTVVFTEGDARPVVVNTKGFAVRAASEPENERVLSGPREGFTECFMPNLALIPPPSERPGGSNSPSCVWARAPTPWSACAIWRACARQSCGAPSAPQAGSARRGQRARRQTRDLVTTDFRPSPPWARPSGRTWSPPGWSRGAARSWWTAARSC